MSNIEKKPFIQRIDKKIRIAAAGVVLAASLGMGMEACTNQPDKPGITTTISGETAQPRLTSENWMTIRQSEIHNYLAPELQLVEGTASTISSSLQDKAKQAGYTIIYQGDPDDTTGRTIIAKNRESDGINSPVGEDLGFGETTSMITGVFKAWVPKPSDAQQQNDIYALLEDPSTKKDYLVDISLKPFDANNKTQSTFFVVDDLNKSYAQYGEWLRKRGGWLPSAFIPEDINNPNAQPKTIDDFPTFEDLLGKTGLSHNINLQNTYKDVSLNLDNLAQPGDYIVVWKQNSPSAGSAKDQNGINKATFFIVRRFGGTAEWNQEVGIK